MKTLKGKLVLITGAAGGIGSVLAKRLYCREQSSLLLVDKDLEGLTRLKAEIENDDQSRKDPRPTTDLEVFQADLSSKSAIREFCRQIETKQVDVMINNAGIVYSGSFQAMDLDNFDRLLDINLRAAIHLTHRLLPKLIERNGFIVFVSSGCGLVSAGVCNAYSTSKFGLVGFSEALRAELWGRVGVSTICPAFVNTNIMDNSLSNFKIDRDARNQPINAMGRYVHGMGVSPDKIAKIIIKSIKKNKGLVPVGAITHMSWFTKRISPFLADLCNVILYRQLEKEGTIK